MLPGEAIQPAPQLPDSHRTDGYIYEERPVTDATTARQILLTRRSPAYWRATFDHPPLNIFGPETIPGLSEVITALEADEQVKVVVFDSAVDGFFLTHYSFLAKPAESTKFPPGPTGLQALPDMLARLRRASREKAILSQWEVGAGLVPGGGPMARPRLIGRGRALEVLLGADDIDGDLAELYGYVNRSLPDSELDSFVDSHATRISSFDEHAIGETKRLVKSTACRRRRDRAPNGTHLSLRLRARKRRREFRSCSTAAFTIPEMSRRGSGTTSVCWAAMTRETSEPTANKGIES